MTFATSRAWARWPSRYQTIVAERSGGGALSTVPSSHPPPLTFSATRRARPLTVVQYAEGAREQARDVAEVIGIGADAISPLDQGTRTVAGDAAQVVVTVGADQNQNQAQAPSG